jgi:hypothetical protein
MFTFRCKVIGPTVGFVVGVLTAVVAWPLGALVYCCNRPAGNRAFSTPVNIYGTVKDAFPI